jgi:restriction system protein
MPTEFVSYMPRVLDALRAMGGAAKPRDVYDWVAKEIKLPEEKRWERDAKGNFHFQNQVQWARQHLFWGGSARGVAKSLSPRIPTELHHRPAAI